MEEVWKTIESLPNYEISNLGQVRNKKNNRIRKPYLKNQAYYYFIHMVGKKTINYALHRLVAEAFIPNPDNLPCVNHKDENKANNCVDNLEWISYLDNANYGTRNERISETKNKYKDDGIDIF